MGRLQTSNISQKNKADIIILCGGLGSRLRDAVPEVPKVLAPIKGRSFLDILLNYIKKQGFKKIILSTGYLGKIVKTHFKNNPDPPLFSYEKSPLGTGGAVKKNLNLTTSSETIIMNGDSFCPVNLNSLLKFHRNKQAIMTMVLSSKPRPDSGKVAINSKAQITGFLEKTRTTKKSLMNAGIYVFNKKIASLMPRDKIFSLEKDFFPKLIKNTKCYGYVAKNRVIDIGTPARYKKAQKYLRYK